MHACRSTLEDPTPWLRPAGGEPDPVRGVRGLSRAWDVLKAVPCLGGERSHPEGALGWHEAWQRAALLLEKPAQASGGLEDRASRQRNALQLELASLGPAVEELTSVMSLVADGKPLVEIWRGLSAWCEHSLKLPPASPPVLSLLEERVRAYPQTPEADLRGTQALDWLEQEVADGKVPSGRFGSPALYLGSLRGMQGLSFRAVRVLGLVEGSVPSSAREDAVLSDAARRALSPYLPTSRERAHRQLASLDDTVRGARDTLVLSAPRVGIDGGARQPAAVLLDVMRALGEAATELEEALETRAQRTRARERSHGHAFPLTRSAQLARIAHGVAGAPVAQTTATSLASMRAVLENASTQAGVLTGLVPFEQLAGATAEEPISASKLATLLSCGHRYLLENILYLRDPSSAQPSHEIDAASFGSLLHEVAETFWREHGTGFGERARPLAQYAALLRRSADALFDDFAAGYAFRSESVSSAQRSRLHEQLTKLLEYDWNDSQPRRFISVERGFGYDEPCVIDTPAGSLFVRGNIDRLDVDGDSVLVRDLKTGASKARRANDPPDVSTDLQLAVYARVLEHKAQAWELPPKIGVAYVYLRSGEIERSWRGNDYPALRDASEEWLATALDTLQAGAFVRSTNPDDCRFCAHRALCEPHRERTPTVLLDARVPQRLKVLKSGEMP